MEALVSAVARKAEGGEFTKDVPRRDEDQLAPVGNWKKPLRSAGCAMKACTPASALAGVSDGEKIHQGLTGVKDGGRTAEARVVSPCTNVEHLPNWLISLAAACLTGLPLSPSPEDISHHRPRLRDLGSLVQNP